MIRFGLAGLGRHGTRYARHLQQGDVPGASLTAVWRRDAERGRAQAAELGVEYCAQLADLVARADVDAVVLAVPSGRHAELALTVAATSKPLLIEKPLARTTAEAMTIICAFERANAPLTVAQTIRFDPLLHAGRRAVASLGPLVGFGFEQRLEPRGLAWEEDPTLAGGGVLAQTAIHAVDALRFVTECREVEVVNALLARVQTPAGNASSPLENHGLLQLAVHGCPAAPGAVIGDVRASKIGVSRHHRYSLFHQAGGVELDFIDRQLVTTVGRTRTAWPVPEVPTVVDLLRAFVAFLQGVEPNPVEPRDAMQSLAVIEAAYAAATGVRTE